MKEPMMAESTAKRKQPKVLDHIRIKGDMETGGHIVEHHYTGYEHEPKIHRFNEDGKSQGGQHIYHHLMKHAGMPPVPEGSAEAEGMEQEEMG